MCCGRTASPRGRPAQRGVPLSRTFEHLRPIVDDGWTDPSRQIGLTGKIARPALYIAAGISGASQHMVGCSAAKTIVAVNKDPEAAIFRHARYGIVGDCLEILPELIRAAKA